MQKDCLKIAEETFKEIQNKFPKISMKIAYDKEQVDLSLHIPRQSRLDFDMTLTLQDLDEFHIYVKDIHSSFFPASQQRVVDLFYQTAVGLITGEYRILQLKKEDVIIKSMIQRPKNDK